MKYGKRTDRSGQQVYRRVGYEKKGERKLGGQHHRVKKIFFNFFFTLWPHTQVG